MAAGEKEPDKAKPPELAPFDPKAPVKPADSRSLVKINQLVLSKTYRDDQTIAWNQERFDFFRKALLSAVG